MNESSTHKANMKIKKKKNEFEETSETRQSSIFQLNAKLLWKWLSTVMFNHISLAH